jgi:hypothetical protein
MTGDGAADEADTALLSAVDIRLPAAKPGGCADGNPEADWQVTAPPDVECAPDERAVLILAVGGGAVQLTEPNDAAGMRWMAWETAGLLDEHDIPHQIISVAPGFNGTAEPQPDAERWTRAFVEQRLNEQPCLQLLTIGHSHGGAFVTGLAAYLEEAGLGDRIVKTVVIDRVTALWSGSMALPQSTPVFNVYIAVGDTVEGVGIEQDNVENWDASQVQAPENGEKGGKLIAVNHTTVDNSPDVRDRVLQEVREALGL